MSAANTESSAGEPEGRVGAQPVEIVGILVAAGDRKDTGAQDVGHGECLDVTAEAVLRGANESIRLPAGY